MNEQEFENRETFLTPREIARVAHQVNKAFCEATGDTSQPEWEDAPDWQQDSAYQGVLFHQANPSSTPEDSHKSWLSEKSAGGWKYGPTKDPLKLEHPCMVPYEALPKTQQAKDYLFSALVKSLSN